MGSSEATDCCGGGSDMVCVRRRIIGWCGILAVGITSCSEFGLEKKNRGGTQRGFIVAGWVSIEGTNDGIDTMFMGVQN